jgi:hypothetical protein
LHQLGEAGFRPAPDGVPGGDLHRLLDESLSSCRAAPLPAVEPIRALHHFACTGGTLVTKCIAAMPNVQLLSEVDPLFPGPLVPPARPRFTPSDMPALLRQSTRGVDEALLGRVFRAELHEVHADATARGLRLVLRDHAHTHYCRGPSVPDRPSLRQLVAPVAPLRSVVTVRHPVDSFASLVANAWVNFSPPDLDTYCQRYLRFLDDHDGVPIMRYEDLARDPAHALSKLCEWFMLPFNADFEQLFPAFIISGDSGRSGESIGIRPRRPEVRQFDDEASRSEACWLLMSRLDYDLKGRVAAASP